ncbi:Outer membrane protein A precursor [Vibrio jasicida]|uniref:OmpA family protein n=1 Tax=Vibrio jasicida TaxID=766224 RepID=UPI0028939F83|nr:Outer membrane protein A precursor [Vibrio jasicida]
MKKNVLIAPIIIFFSPLSISSELYSGLSLGRSWLDNSCNSSSLCDDVAQSMALKLGNQFTPWFGLELQYSLSGKYSGEYLNGDFFHSISLSPKLSYNLNDSLNVYGKLGGAYLTYNKMDDWATLSAFGFEFFTDNNLSYTLEYSSINNVDYIVDDISLREVSIGLNYAFGAKTQKEDTAKEELQQVSKLPVRKKIVNPHEVATIYYPFDSAIIKASEKSKIDEIIDYAKKYPEANFVIEGFSDDVGPSNYNKKLSKLRAESVKKDLIAKGVTESKIDIKAMGETCQKEGRAFSRKAKITVEMFSYYEKQ